MSGCAEILGVEVKPHVWEVWQGATLVCSREMGLTEREARNKVENEARIGYRMEARRAPDGLLVIDGWAGQSRQPVVIEGETPTRYRVRAVDEELRLPLRGRGVRIVLRSGSVLVPKHAVTLFGARNQEGR